MVGRVESAVGLIFAAFFMIGLGYFLTLNVYRDEGSYVIFYEGRYYSGIACMIVGGVLFLAGIFLPLFWPKAKESGLPSIERKPSPPSPTTLTRRPTAPSEPSSQKSRLIEKKVKGVSMQSTCGKEAIWVLRLLARQEEVKRCDLSEIVGESGIERDKMRKVISVLVSLGLIERSDSEGREGYKIPSDVEAYLVECIKKVDV